MYSSHFRDLNCNLNENMLRSNSYDTEGGESEKRKGGKGRDGIQRKNIEEGASREDPVWTISNIIYYNR
jgi:hypothetical protein